MELINPDGSKAEIKPEAAKPEDAPAPTFKADFNTPGWMKLEVNIEAISHSMQAQWQLMGFMDDHKNKALRIIGQIVAQREQVKAALQKTQSKNGMSRFLGNLKR